MSSEELIKLWELWDGGWVPGACFFHSCYQAALFATQGRCCVGRLQLYLAAAAGLCLTFPPVLLLHAVVTHLAGMLRVLAAGQDKGMNDIISAEQVQKLDSPGTIKGLVAVLVAMVW